MRIIRYGMFLLYCVCLATPSTMCKAIDLSAERVWHCTVGYEETRTHIGKLYISGNKVRLEMSMVTMIFDGDRKLYWKVFPKQKVYSERSYHSSNKPIGVIDNSHLDEYVRDGQGTKRGMGTEKMNGYLCRKIRYVFPGAGTNPPCAATVWYSDKLRCPIKEQSRMRGNEEISEYKNIRIGKQDDSLFKVPEGYKKVEREPDTTIKYRKTPERKQNKLK